VQRLDVDPWDLHEPVVPAKRSLLTSAAASRGAVQRSDAFAQTRARSRPGS
jgi:hypothetical protein